MELPIPILSKFISYQFLLILFKGANHEQLSQNNYSACGAPLKVWGDFFEKKVFHGNLKEG